MKNRLQQDKCSLAQVFKWHERFRNGRESLADNESCGRTPSVSKSFVERTGTDVKTEDRRLTIDELLQTTQRIVSQFGGQWYTDTFTLGEVAQKMLAFKWRLCRKGLKQLRVYTIC